LTRIRLGLESTKILLTDIGKNWFVEAYPKGAVHEYDEGGSFDLKSMGVSFVEVTCPLGIPYRHPTDIDGEITFKMADRG